MRWLHFILSHSIFISFCAAGLSLQTFILLHIPANGYVISLVFFATLASYNFYWLISKYYFSKNVPAGIFFRRHFSNLLFAVTGAAGLMFSLFYLPQIYPAVAVATLLTVVYSIPLWPVKALAFTRKAGFLKTVLLAFTWTYVTVMIPVESISFSSSLSVNLLFAARFLFMLMLCIIFDARDVQVDKIHALRSLATDVSKQFLELIMIIVFFCYLVCGFILRWWFDDTAQVLAFFITGLVTYLVYRLSLRVRNYFFYYFLVDGLMLFSALATFIATI